MVMIRPKVRSALTPLALLLGMTGAVLATTIKWCSFEEYVADATAIVRGQIVDTTAVFPDRGIAHTVAHLLVQEVMKGDGPDIAPGQLVDVRYPGARDATRLVRVEGTPTLAPGHEVILFLWREPHTGNQLVYGWSQGTYHVIRDPDSGSRSLSGLHAAPGEVPHDFVGRIQAELTRPHDAR
jgi:hypothetical protein